MSFKNFLLTCLTMIAPASAAVSNPVGRQCGCKPAVSSTAIRCSLGLLIVIVFSSCFQRQTLSNASLHQQLFEYHHHHHHHHQYQLSSACASCRESSFPRVEKNATHSYEPRPPPWPPPITVQGTPSPSVAEATHRMASPWYCPHSGQMPRHALLEDLLVKPLQISIRFGSLPQLEDPVQLPIVSWLRLPPHLPQYASTDGRVLTWRRHRLIRLLCIADCHGVPQQVNGVNSCIPKQCESRSSIMPVTVLGAPKRV